MPLNNVLVVDRQGLVWSVLLICIVFVYNILYHEVLHQCTVKCFNSDYFASLEPKRDALVIQLRCYGCFNIQYTNILL